MQTIIENLSAQPLGGVIPTVFFFLLTAYGNYLLLDALLKMHRSKSALKKLKKNYTFFQRVWLMQFKGNCRHAVKFCSGMIIYQRIGWVLLAIYLLAALLYAFGFCPAVFVSWLFVAIFVCFCFPSEAIDLALKRPFLFGRFREYSFEKYHNTGNHKSLL